MLVALSIRSFVLIDCLDLEAGSGFIALTGETGAGKSIILDALSLVLGGPVDRKQIRKGAKQAVLSAEFAVPNGHPAWGIMAEHGLDVAEREALILRRVVPLNGPSRGFVNDQPVSAAFLAELGESLVEIHGQHAASQLMQAAKHRAFLDAFGGHEKTLGACEAAWHAFSAAKAKRVELEAACRSAREREDWLRHAVGELEALAPEAGETERLTSQRSVYLQSERVSEAVYEAREALHEAAIESALSTAARALDRILHIPELASIDGPFPAFVHTAAESVERTLIELGEAQSGVRELFPYADHDGRALEEVEARLFSLRAAARKYDCAPEALDQTLIHYRSVLALCEADSEALDDAVHAEGAAEAEWGKAAEALTAARQKAAKRFEAALIKELTPLHLARVKVRVGLTQIAADESGAKGLERVEFEVETNPGAGFGPLKRVASGGELARFALALKCALSAAGSAPTLIFDEADQGVGGAVAAAIGERLAGLSEGRQVFAVTHSPQVASSATHQWRVMKQADAKQHFVTQVTALDERQRLEEIARMLSGSSITDEARAAASKLLEAA